MEEISLSKQGDSLPARRPDRFGRCRPRSCVSRSRLARIGLETRISRPVPEHTAPVPGDSRLAPGDFKFIGTISDFVRVIPDWQRAVSSSAPATAGTQLPGCCLVPPTRAIARTLMPDPPKSSFHRAQSMPVRGAPKPAPGDSQHRIAFWNLIRVTGSVIRHERRMESAVGCDERLIGACAALARRMDSQLPSGIKSSAIVCSIEYGDCLGNVASSMPVSFAASSRALR